MVPLSLKGIYRQYKEDTDFVAEWLVVTAKLHGYNSGVGLGSRKRVKPKTKARGSNTTSTTHEKELPIEDESPDEPTYLVELTEFEPLAEFLAKVPKLEIPEYFTASLQRVIRVRSNFSQQLASSGVSIDSESNERHSYFVQILERVQTLLKPHMGSISAKKNRSTKNNTKASNKANNNAKQNEGGLQNIFCALDVYNTSQEFEAAPNVVLPQKVKVTFIAEQGDSFIDAFFAFLTILHDYRELRDEINTLWAEFDSGQRDLAAVSVATNMAFELARAMEDLVAPLISKHGGITTFLGTILRAISETNDIDLGKKQCLSDPYNLEAYHLMDVCLVNPMKILESFLHDGMFEKLWLQTYQGGAGWYDEELGACSATNSQKWKQDFTAAVQLMPDLSFLVHNAQTAGGVFILDEMTRGMADIVNRGTNNNTPPPLYLGFALQIYLDILQSFGSSCGKAFEEMQQEALKMKHSMLNVPLSSPEREKLMRVVCGWDCDPIWTCRQTLVDAGMRSPQCSRPFQFLRYNPMYCGLLLHDMRATLHFQGLRYAITPRAMVGLVHLYNAIRHEKLVPDDVVWEDLEMLWKLQGDASFFVGNPPTTLKDSYTNHCLSLGISAQNWAANRRGDAIKANDANRRKLKLKAYLSLYVGFRLHTQSKKGWFPWSTSNITQLLVDGTQERYQDSREHLRPEFKDIVEKEQTIIRNLPPAGLIRRVASDLEYETEYLCFNLFIMQNQAWSYLEKVQQAMGRILGPGARSRFMESSGIPELAGSILSFAAGYGPIEANMRKQQRIPKNRRFLLAAADILRKSIQEGKGRIVKQQMETKTLDRMTIAKILAMENGHWSMEVISDAVGVTNASRETRSKVVWT